VVDWRQIFVICAIVAFVVIVVAVHRIGVNIDRRELIASEKSNESYLIN
jgi:hypothetical protein